MIKKIKKLLFSILLSKNVQKPYTDDLKGSVVAVTGASRGIGKAIAKRFLNCGASVAVISRNLKELESAYKENIGQEIILLSGDVGLEKDVSKMMDKVLTRFGKIDLLVNNAGIFMDKPIDLTTAADFDSILSTNVKGVFLMTKAAVVAMKKNKNGLIINIGSKISHNSNVSPNKVLYATTKYAIEGFSFALNRELKNFGIRIVCLMPGTVNTFISLKAKSFMFPDSIAELVLMVFKFHDIDFESIVFKSKYQDI